MADTPTDAPAPDTAPTQYTVNRSQDGAQVRAELSLEDAQRECADLSASARQQVGMTEPVYDEAGVMVRSAVPIFASMLHGQVSRYEVRSASGLVI